MRVPAPLRITAAFLSIAFAVAQAPARPAEKPGHAQTPPPVVPKPKHWEFLAGSLRYVPSRTGLQLLLADSREVEPAIEELRTTSVALFGAPPGSGSGYPVTIRAGVAGADAHFDRLCRARGVFPDKSLGPEGYTLLVLPGSVLVAAPETPGLFYGLLTLNQLLRAAAGAGAAVPAVRIIDWPDLRVRGVMDDISRGPVPTPAYFRLQIRRLAEMKVNTVSYYTEHMVATRSHPEFAPPGAALSIEEWKDLAGFARRYHIDLVGNFQSFGHFANILAQPRYARLAEGKSLLSPAFEESYDLLRDIYSEMVPAFSAPFFLTNCDETFDLGKGASKRLVDSLGIGTVYAHHVLRLREMLARLGVRMMIWGDVLLEHPEAIDLIPRDVMIGTWTYDSLADYHRYIRPFRSRGFDVLVTPGVLNSFSVLPNLRVSCPNVERFVRDGIADSVLGAMTTVWDDGGNALFARDWYGVAFAADRMWHCDTTDGSFDGRFDAALYGDRTGSASRGIQRLLQLTDLAPTDGLYERAIWSPVLPPPGRTLRLNVRDWDRVFAIAGAADSLFLAGRPLVYPGDLAALHFSANLFQAAARLRLGALDASRSYARAAGGHPTDASRTREDLARALGTLTSLQAEFTSLKSRYESLWLAESRLHALDSITRYYDETINALHDAGGRVRSALGAWEQGRPLPAPADVCLAVLESNGWYFRDWLVTGPITGDSLETDRLVEMGGEGNADPKVTQEFPSGGATYRWKRLSALVPEVDLRAEFDPPQAATAYAFATLESPSAGNVPALIGVGGTLRLFVNGTQVLQENRPDSLAVDAHRALLPLRQGRNRILIKTCSAAGMPWGFSLRLPDADVRNRKNRYRIER